jgi:hypothetical protein
MDPAVMEIFFLRGKGSQEPIFIERTFFQSFQMEDVDPAAAVHDTVLPGTGIPFPKGVSLFAVFHKSGNDSCCGKTDGDTMLFHIAYPGTVQDPGCRDGTIPDGSFKGFPGQRVGGGPGSMSQCKIGLIVGITENKFTVIIKFMERDPDRRPADHFPGIRVAKEKIKSAGKILYMEFFQSDGDFSGPGIFIVGSAAAPGVIFPGTVKTSSIDSYCQLQQKTVSFNGSEKQFDQISFFPQISLWIRGKKLHRSGLVPGERYIKIFFISPQGKNIFFRAGTLHRRPIDQIFENGRSGFFPGKRHTDSFERGHGVVNKGFFHSGTPEGKGYEKCPSRFLFPGRRALNDPFQNRIIL